MTVIHAMMVSETWSYELFSYQNDGYQIAFFENLGIWVL